jgi:2-polyprenyl-6-methoxyphenol hydroxylase-like FAD-dependent oxidoreductase
MASGIYDIITVGGGLGGAALAKAMAEHGARVLVLEQETRFKDRVRGEGMHAWGVPEANALGLYELLRTTCGLEVRWWNIDLGPQMIAHRDFIATTPHQSPLFGFYHPDMQEVLLTAAEEAGAEVWRGALVRDVRPGRVPTVSVDHKGQRGEMRARLVVAADGRSSPTRQWAGFAVQSDPQRRLFTAVEESVMNRRLMRSLPRFLDALIKEQTQAQH